MAANLAVAFFASFGQVVHEFAFDPSSPHLLNAFTCIFLHDPQNILHLLGNLVFLAAVGPLVEASVGPAKFGAIYIVSGLAGVGAHWAIAVSSGVYTPLIGASSSIAGCVGYCCIRYVRSKVPLAPKLHVPVAAIVLVWVLLQAVGAFVKFEEAGGTSYIAHIGGFVSGLALAFVFKAQTAVSRERGQEEISAMVERSPAAVLQAAERHLAAHPDDARATWHAVDALQTMGEVQKQAGLLRRLLSVAPERERAVARLASIGALSQVPSTDRMRLAPLVGEETRLLLYKSVVDADRSDTERPYALLALAEETDDASLLEALRTEYEFHAATDLARAKGLIQ